jgi:penicillin-binding protein 2
MSKYNFEIEPHEVLLDKLAQEKERKFGISEIKMEVPIYQKNFHRFFYLSLTIFLVVFLRTLQLQTIEGKKYLSLAKENAFLIQKIKAERGVIYDRNFKQLVYNRPAFNLVVKKDELPKSEEEKKAILEEVAKILEIDPKSLKERIEKELDKEFVIFPNLETKPLIILETKIDKLSGFEIRENLVREYPEGENFSHLVGYMSKIQKEEWEKEKIYYSISDYVGRDGLEKYYEKTLRENRGEIRVVRDAKGNIVSKEMVSLPSSGKSLVLWLDADLQKKIKEELEKKMKEVGAKGGAGVALDPKNGGILAMVSLPSFDNNLFFSPEKENLDKILNDPQKPLFNRALNGQYLLGSTVKPLIALAALEEKIISPNTKLDCQGEIVIPNPYHPDKPSIFHDWTVHGLTEMRKAIAESCNVYFYTIGGGFQNQKGLGPTKIKQYLQLFDLGKTPKVDLPFDESASGLIGDPAWKMEKLKQRWWDGDTYNLSIGQGYILANPLQIAKAFSAVANGGKLVEPRVVWKIIDENKNEIEEIKTEERELPIDKKNLEIVREGMRWAVTGQNSPRASAIALNDLPVSAAAKTGTAQTFRKNCSDCYTIWIVTFAPYEDPKIVLVLILEDVRGRLSQLVVPVAREVLNWYFTR